MQVKCNIAWDLTAHKLSRVMAKWGSTNLDELATLRQKVAAINRANSDETGARSGSHLFESRSDLHPVPEERSNEIQAIQLNHDTVASSPFASAFDMTNLQDALEVSSWSSVPTDLALMHITAEE